MIVYRAQVVNNEDPEGLSRLKVAIPELGLESSEWAPMCLPFGANPANARQFIPDVGVSVWVALEDGTERPLVLGVCSDG